MENEKWKSFINDHRDEFEKESPSGDLWSRIDTSLQQRSPRMVRLSTVITIAASVVIIIGAGLFFYFNPFGSSSGELFAEHTSVKQQQEEYILSSISPEYKEVETYYVSRINAAMNELESFTPDQELLDAIADLDAEFKQLKKEMSENVNREEIVEAMIQNYRLKLDLLEKMLESFQEESNEGKVEKDNDYKTI